MANKKQAKCANCDQCPLQSHVNQLVRSSPIQGEYDLIVVGEFPHAHEVLVNQPVTGQSKMLLEQVLTWAGINPARVYYTNALLCNPKFASKDDRKLKLASAACSGRLAYALGQLPDIPVLALGRLAQEALGLEYAEGWQQEEHTGKWAIGTFSLNEVFGIPTNFYLFKQVVKKVGAQRVNLPPVPEPVIVQTVEDLPDSFESYPYITVDIETDTLAWRDPNGAILCVGIGLPVNDGVQTYILPDEFLHTSSGRQWIQWFAEQYQDKIGGHNYKFDTLFQNNHLGTVRHVAWDTMLMANSIHEYNRKSLKDLATLHLDAEPYDEVVSGYLACNFKKKEDRHFGNVPRPLLYEYLNLDLYYNTLLVPILTEQLKQLGKWDMPYLAYEIPLNNTLIEVEAGGWRVDEAQIEEASRQFQADLDPLRKHIQDLTGGKIVNPNSTKQVADYIWGVLKIPFPKMAGYKPPTTAYPVLVEIEETHPIVKKIVQYRRIAKLKSSYLDNLGTLIFDGYTHPSYKQAHVITGRLSAVQPAIQTIPKKNEKRDGAKNYGKTIKECYVADPDQVLVVVDGSQWELRTAAGWSGDKYLLSIYNDGIDFHGAMCDLLYGPNWNEAMRSTEKNIMFGLLYGGTLESLVSVADITKEQKQRVIDVFYTELTDLIRWRDQMFETARTQGVLTAPYYNRDFHFDLVTRVNKRDVQKDSVNYPVQGTASMITSDAMRMALSGVVRLGGRIVGTVHDSIVATSPVPMQYRVAAAIARKLEFAGQRAFPMLPWVAEAEAGYRWGNLQKFSWREMEFA